jgi:hypothetical protein
MVVSDRLPSPRTQWTRGGSWRNYINTHSNRKLQIDLSLDLTQERHAKFDTTQNRVEEIAEEDAALKEVRWYNVRTDNCHACQAPCSFISSSSSMYIYLAPQKADYDAFERDRQLTALQFRTLKKNGRPLIEREHSMRGLEDLVESEGENNKCPRASERTEHLRRVLEEQTRQRATGSYPNDTMLREISCKSSREARQRSARVGEADALVGHVSSSRALGRQINGVINTLSRKLQP